MSNVLHGCVLVTATVFDVLPILIVLLPVVSIVVTVSAVIIVHLHVYILSCTDGLVRKNN